MQAARMEESSRIWTALFLFERDVPQLVPHRSKTSPFSLLFRRTNGTTAGKRLQAFPQLQTTAPRRAEGQACRTPQRKGRKLFVEMPRNGGHTTPALSLSRPNMPLTVVHELYFLELSHDICFVQEYRCSQDCTGTRRNKIISGEH